MQRLAAILFFMTAAFMVAGAVGKKSVFIALGAVFIAVGASNLALSKAKSSA